MILVSPTYKRFDECVQMIRSAYAGTTQPEAVIVTDNSSGKFVEYLRKNQVQLPVNIFIIVSPMNSGCARAWNNMLREAYKINPNAHVLVSNDDIEFEKDTLELFEKAIEENPNELIYVCGGIDSPNAFSLFATRLDKLQNTIGLFDEMFLYPYLEDGDMARRLMLSGRKLFRIEGASAKHIGSATLAAFTEDETLMHHIKFSRNVEYFNMKWGLIDHNDWMSSDGYLEPFNDDEQYKEIVYTTIKNVYGE